MNQSLAFKQAYLYKQIIQTGYDPEQFQLYFETYSTHQAQNLEQFSIATLKQIVQEFKIKKNIVSINKNQEKIIQPSEKETQVKQELKTIISEVENATIYQKIMKCVKTSQTQFFKKKVEVKITKFQKREGGIFEKSYVAYLIKVQPYESIIQRRYSDFEWLREKLMLLHPGFPVPPIAKKGNFARYDEKHLNKRRLILDKFLNKMVTIPEMKADNIFQQFLTIGNKNEFEKFKSKYKGLQTKVQTSRISNLEGELKISLEKNLNSFLANSQKYFFSMQPQIKKIYKGFKACATSLESCSDQFKSISQICTNMNIKDMEFRMNNKLPMQAHNLYSIFQMITSQYHDIFKEQAKLFRNQVYSLIKYESLYMVNIIQNFQNLAALQETFYQTKATLNSKKQKLFVEGNMTKWGLTTKLNANPKKGDAFSAMLPKETAQVLKLSDDYALQMSQLFEETNRYFNETNRNISKYVRNYIQIQSKLRSGEIVLWGDMQAKAMGMEQNKSSTYKTT